MFIASIPRIIQSICLPNQHRSTTHAHQLQPERQAHAIDPMYAGAAVYQAKHQTRCLAAVLGDHERHRFLTGSTSLREPNEVKG